jgi:hypothetical protein
MHFSFEVVSVLAQKLFHFLRFCVHCVLHHLLQCFTVISVGWKVKGEVGEIEREGWCGEVGEIEECATVVKGGEGWCGEVEEGVVVERR